MPPAGSPDPVPEVTSGGMVRGGASLVAARAVSMVLAGAVAILLARSLGPSGFGDLTVVLTVNILLVVVCDFGLPLVASRDWPAVAATARARWLAGFLWLRLRMSLVVTVAATACVALLPLQADLRTGLVVICLGLPATSYLTASANLLSAHFAPGKAAQVETVARILWTSVLVLTIVSGAGVVGVCAGMTGGQWLGAAYARVVVGRALPRPAGPVPAPAALLRRAAPLAALPLLGVVYARVDTLILAAVATAADVGLYGVLYRVLDVLVNVIAVVSGLATPLLVRAATAADRRRLLALLQRYFLLALLPVAGLSAAATGPLVHAIGGESFRRLVAADSSAVTATMALLMAAFGLMLVNLLNAALLLALHEQGRLLRLLFVMIPVNAVLTVALATRLSYVGAAAATFASELASVLWSTMLVRRALGGVELRRALLAPVAVTLATVATYVVAAPLPVAARLAASLAVYAAVVVLSPLRAELRAFAAYRFRG